MYRKRSWQQDLHLHKASFDFFRASLNKSRVSCFFHRKRMSRCDKKLGHRIIKTRNTHIKWQSQSQNYPLALNLWPPKFLLSSIMKGLRSLRGQIPPISLFSPPAFLLFSLTLDHINPQNIIKLPKEPKSHVTICNIDPLSPNRLHKLVLMTPPLKLTTKKKKKQHTSTPH